MRHFAQHYASAKAETGLPGWNRSRQKRRSGKQRMQHNATRNTLIERVRQQAPKDGDYGASFFSLTGRTVGRNWKETHCVSMHPKREPEIDRAVTNKSTVKTAKKRRQNLDSSS